MAVGSGTDPQSAGTATLTPADLHSNTTHLMGGGATLLDSGSSSGGGLLFSRLWESDDFNAAASPVADIGLELGEDATTLSAGAPLSRTPQQQHALVPVVQIRALIDQVEVGISRLFRPFAPSRARTHAFTFSSIVGWRSLRIYFRDRAVLH